MNVDDCGYVSRKEGGQARGEKLREDQKEVVELTEVSVIGRVGRKVFRRARKRAWPIPAAGREVATSWIKREAGGEIREAVGMSWCKGGGVVADEWRCARA